jgi:hypothetical protein
VTTAPSISTATRSPAHENRPEVRRSPREAVSVAVDEADRLESAQVIARDARRRDPALVGDLPNRRHATALGRVVADDREHPLL